MITFAAPLPYAWVNPSGHGINDWRIAVIMAAVGLLLVWLGSRSRRRSARRYEAMNSAKSGAQAQADTLIAGPDTGGHGFTPADLRGVDGPSQPELPADAWLLGLAALEVEQHHLDHGSWSLTPQPRDNAWQRKIEQVLEACDAAVREDWQHWLTKLQHSLTTISAHDRVELANWVSYLAFWIRLGCAAGHINSGEARTLTQSAAARLRGVCRAWDEYAELLRSQTEVSVPGTVALLKEPGWPWHENSWP